MSLFNNTVDIVCTKQQLVDMLFGSEIAQIQHEEGPLSISYAGEWHYYGQSVNTGADKVEFEVGGEIEGSDQYLITGKAQLTQTEPDIFSGKLSLSFELCSSIGGG